MTWRRHALAALLVVAATTGYVTTTTTTQRTLVIADADTGTTLRTIPVDDSTPITLTYTHSVEKTPVEDHYVVDDTTLDNTQMRFKSYGWGLPANANVTLDDGWFEYDPSHEYDALTIKPGRVANHELTVDDTTIDLVALNDADAVTLTIERHVALPLLSSQHDDTSQQFHAANQTTPSTP